MIRKTLVIGLGGTGCSVACAVANRLVWEHGSLSRLPFVDFLCLDTAEDSIEGVLNDRRYFHHMVIDQGTVDRMRRNPDDFKDMLDLPEWIDRAMLRTMGVVRTGTQGFRMLGRLSLLVPENFESLSGAVSSKLHRLLQLTQEEASEAYGSPVQFTRAARIVVVATSCGGTGSGTYVDFGYLLRDQQSRYPNQVETVGILTLPATNVTDTRKTSNTYALLTELNHFSTDGNEYRVKYPDAQHPQHSVFHDYPYDMTYLVTLDVGRSAVGGLRDFNALKRTIGQYIHADAVTRMGAIADGRRNDITGFFSVSDKRGNNQRYMTMGIAFLEYPVHRVARGCSARLLVESLDAWVSDSTAPFDLQGMAEKLGLITPAVVKRLTGELRAAGMSVIDHSMQDWQSSLDFEELEQTLRRAFLPAGDEAGNPAFPPGAVPRGITAKRPVVLAEMLGDLEKYVESRLPLGPRRVLSEVQALIAHVAALMQPAETADDAALQDLKDCLRDTEDDLVLKLSPPVRRAALHHLAREAVAELKDAFERQLASAASETRMSLLDEIRQNLERWATRLQAMGVYAVKLHNEFGRIWQDQDGSIDLNGVLLFRSGSASSDRNVAAESTLEIDYAKLLKAAPALASITDVRAKSREIVSTFVAKRIGTENDRCTIFADIRKSYLDSISNEVVIRRSDLEGCLEEARHFFNIDAIRNDITEAFFRTFPAQDARVAQIDTVASLSDYFLAVEANDADFESHPRKSVSWVMFHGAQDQAGVNREFKELLQSRLGGQWVYEELDAEHAHMAIFLRERGSFPLRLVQGLNAWRTHYEAELRSSDPNSLPTLHSRRDVEWLPINEQDRDELERAKELFLVGIALDLLERNGGGVTWVYSPTTRDRSIRPLELSGIVDRGARRLRENPRTLDLLDAQIHDWREGGARDEELIGRLFGPKGLLERLPYLGVSGLGEDVAEGAERILNRFLARNPALQQAHMRVYPPDPLLFERLFHKEGDPRPKGGGSFPMTGYYCDRCPVFFGAEEVKVPARCTCGRVFRG